MTITRNLRHATSLIRRYATTADSTVQGQARRINIHRLFYVASVAIPVNIAHILIFWRGVAVQSEAEMLWRLGIIYSHSVLLVLMLAFALASGHLTRTDEFASWMQALQYLAIMTVMGAGVSISAIDQLVRDAMTPFLAACMLVGVVFLIRPVVSLLMYAIAYAFYFYAMGLVQPDETVLFSNVVNGISAVGLGFVVSGILWTTSVTSSQKQAYIAEQRYEIEEKNKALERLASVDPLTGLLNRRRFEETAAREISRMRRFGGESCLAIIDIDYFKRFNDEHGHPAGDELLRGFAELLRSNVRAYDLLSRWGGEEFIILFPQTSLAQGQIIAEKLRNAIDTTALLSQGRKIHVTATFGLAGVNLESDNPFMDSYRRADRALYSAKEAGRNRIAIS